MTSGELLKHIEGLQLEIRECGNGKDPAGDGLVIEGSFNNRITFLDRRGLKETGKLDICFWAPDSDARYPSFAAFLEGYVSELDQMIEDERENSR
jgi:hypothetical protein